MQAVLEQQTKRLAALGMRAGLQVGGQQRHALKNKEREDNKGRQRKREQTQEKKEGMGKGRRRETGNDRWKRGAHVRMNGVEPRKVEMKAKKKTKKQRKEM